MATGPEPGVEQIKSLFRWDLSGGQCAKISANKGHLLLGNLHGIRHHSDVTQKVVYAPFTSCHHTQNEAFVKVFAGTDILEPVSYYCI